MTFFSSFSKIDNKKGANFLWRHCHLYTLVSNKKGANDFDALVFNTPSYCQTISNIKKYFCQEEILAKVRGDQFFQT